MPNDLVIVEWYSFERFPRIRHAVAVQRVQAVQWLLRNLPITIHEVDPELLHEQRSGSPR
jgi:hypothetical protein